MLIQLCDSAQTNKPQNHLSSNILFTTQMRKLAKWIKHQNQKNVPEFEVVIPERVKNLYKNVINQKNGDIWLASHMVNRDLSQPCAKDTTMIPKWLITRCWNPRWWNSTVHANNVNSLGRKHSSIVTDGDLKITHLVVWLCTPLLSSPLFIPCTCLHSACLCCGHQVETYHSYQHFRKTWRQNQSFLFAN
jgi:hypothetical protein